MGLRCGHPRTHSVPAQPQLTMESFSMEPPVVPADAPELGTPNPSDCCELLDLSGASLSLEVLRGSRQEMLSMDGLQGPDLRIQRHLSYRKSRRSRAARIHREGGKSTFHVPARSLDSRAYL